MVWTRSACVFVLSLCLVLFCRRCSVSISLTLGSDVGGWMDWTRSACVFVLSLCLVLFCRRCSVSISLTLGSGVENA
ncbi:hypothetical protein C8Q80DRAFT_1186262 [Daedaleopsis nitida]|nr:hypothetical protein C8Q80DRAFT_1186262 [Daedaleopsis nitida]